MKMMIKRRVKSVRRKGYNDSSRGKKQQRKHSRLSGQKTPHKGINVTQDSCLMARKLRYASVCRYMGGRRVWARIQEA